MHRWTARFLLLIMLVPAFGPLALARAAQPEAMHCIRKPAQPGMQCHHAMAKSPLPESSENTFRALDGCCPNHDCCRGASTSEWARPAAHQTSDLSLLIEPAPAPQGAATPPTGLSGSDSARAPPRR